MRAIWKGPFQPVQMLNPVLDLKDDILNFLEAIIAESNPELIKSGYEFIQSLNQYADDFDLSNTKEFFEICLLCSEEN